MARSAFSTRLKRSTVSAATRSKKLSNRLPSVLGFGVVNQPAARENKSLGVMLS
jgi:hypothetical protein